MSGRISIVIVNYNVRFFLEQCLKSIFRAAQGLDVEVFVVDNHSSDSSVQMVQKLFPQVKLIANKHNPGFSTANNQAIKQATGEYILLLNPDTVLEENTLRICFEHMQLHPECGASGAKHMDGKGKYLPESKRGLPTPLSAFYKLFGFAKLFPHSAHFAHYYLGHLSEHQNQIVEVLSGAFMFIRKEALDKAGWLDEQFFMYGEDIDLSYRIRLAGYQLHYLSKAHFIHYKGESTQKNSFRFVYHFYQAMLLFARKHYSKRQAYVYSLLIYSAIFLRAGISLFRRLFHKIGMPAADAILIALGLYLAKVFWAQTIETYYPYTLVKVGIPLATVLFVFSTWLSGGYDRPYTYFKTVRSVFIASILLFTLYAFLPESYRFSRFLLLSAPLVSVILMILARVGYNLMVEKKLFPLQSAGKQLLIVGAKSEQTRIQKLLHLSGSMPAFIGAISYSKTSEEGFLGHLEQLPEILSCMQIDEIIFSTKDTQMETIMACMRNLASFNLHFKTAPSESTFLIGTNSIDEDQEWFVSDLNNISLQGNLRKKRLLDILVSLTVLMLFPFLLLPRKGRRLLSFALTALIGQNTWMGYIPCASHQYLPSIKTAHFHLLSHQEKNLTEPNLVVNINLLYAKNYTALKDLKLIVKAILNFLAR